LTIGYYLTIVLKICKWIHKLCHFSKTLPSNFIPQPSHVAISVCFQTRLGLT